LTKMGIPRKKKKMVLCEGGGGRKKGRWGDGEEEHKGEFRTSARLNHVLKGRVLREKKVRKGRWGRGKGRERKTKKFGKYSRYFKALRASRQKGPLSTPGNLNDRRRRASAGGKEGGDAKRGRRKQNLENTKNLNFTAKIFAMTLWGMTW